MRRARVANPVELRRRVALALRMATSPSRRACAIAMLRGRVRCNMTRAMRWIALAVLAAACTQQGSVPSGGDDSVTPPSDAPALGAHWASDGTAVEFRLASTRATRVELWIYAAATGASETKRVPLDRGDDGVWFARVAAADLPPTIYYGYRVWGPNWAYDPAWQPGSEIGFITDVDSAGNRMNPNKLVFDPYARELSHDPTTVTQPDGAPYAVGSRRAIDSAPVAPKGIVLPRDAEAPLDAAKPMRPFSDSIIYEVHLRGFTKGDATTPCAGTFAGAATRAAYLADLGVTAVEFLPVQEASNDRNDLDPASASGDNYWGYSTLDYFAPDRRYACDQSAGGPTREVRDMVTAFHAHGIEVYVDVVYNHTAEGGGSSLLTLRGIDNAGYYQLDRAGTGFTNSNGVGADLATMDKPLARGLLVDSLKYWRDVLGVDGFRFDLAPVLGNACGPGCFRFDPTVHAQLASELSDVDLIAEPWGTVAGSYQVGHLPAGWSEWNDKFRDAIKQDQNKTPVPPAVLADRITGSSPLYRPAGRAPSASINYLVSHDGFTLHDLYACNASNNTQAWPYGPSDGGSTNNLSWDHGGDAAAQRQAARTGLALMLVSAGVPMLTGGDELGRTLRCNNNSYNLDSPATWLDWSTMTDVVGPGSAFWTFAQRLFHFRAAHPALRPATWIELVSWRDATGAPTTSAYMNDATKPVLAWRLDGAPLADDTLYLAYNRSAATVRITLPAPANGRAWYRAADTAAWMEPQANFAAPGDEYRMMQSQYDLGARSIAMFIER